MDYQIRHSFFETSSNSASSFIMVSDKGKRQRVELSEPWICVRGNYCTGDSGIPHEYICRWQDKMALLAEDTPLWHNMFKKATGQDFKLYKLYTRTWDESWKDEENHNTDGVKRLYNIPNGIVFDVSKPINDRVSSENGTMITYCCDLDDQLAVALPADTPSKKICGEYALEKCFKDDDEPIRTWHCFINEIGGENFDEDILEELIFNPGFAVNIGGDGYNRDNGAGIVNGYLNDMENCSALKRAGYSLFDCCYKNGGELLLMGHDGTKLRIHRDDTPPEYPEAIDLKITDKCCNECAFCYENSTPDGLHGKITNKLFEQIPPFTEIAVGGGNPLLHPDFFDLHDRFGKLRFNATLHADDFLSCCRDKDKLTGLLRFDAVGISVSRKEQSKQIAKYLKDISTAMGYHYENELQNHSLGQWNRNGLCSDAFGFFEDTYLGDYEITEFSDPVIHVINYVVNEDILLPLYDKGLKLLILGYKTKGRGFDYIKDHELNENFKWLYDNIEDVARHFDAVAFDALALKQLDIRRLVSDEDWRHLYMGDDGHHTMYIDLVRGEYGLSSTDNRRWKLTDDLKQMFAHVRDVALGRE